MRSSFDRFPVAIVVLGLLCAAARASATPPLQKKAKAAGFPASDCVYCHTFDVNHMRDRARTLGISNMNCVSCHGDRLPKMGVALYNERGRFLLAQKIERQAKEVDVEWLKDYVEKGEPKEKKKDKGGKSTD